MAPHLPPDASVSSRTLRKTSHYEPGAVTSPTFIKSLLLAAGGLHVRAQACPSDGGRVE